MKSFKTLSASLLASACIVGSALAQTAPIKIGFIAELSGPQGALGQDQYDALMLLVNRNGGKLGGFPVQVLREDSQLKPELAVQIVDKLIEKEHVPIITGVTFSNVMMAIHKKITSKEVFLIGSNAGPSTIAGAQCSPYFFSTSWENGQQAEVIGRYATNHRLTKMVAIAPNYQAGKDFVAGFKRYYNGVVTNELYPALTTQDFSSEIAQIQAAQPQAVFVFLPGGLGINFIKQWNQAGLKDKIPLLSASTADGTTLPAMGDAAIGVLAGTVWGEDFKNAANQKFVSEFEAKYKRIPSQYAAQSYDAAQLLDSAIRKVKGKVEDKPAFMAALKAADFKSIRGNVKYNSNHFLIQDLHIFEAYKNAKGQITLRTKETPLQEDKDAFYEKCALK